VAALVLLGGVIQRMVPAASGSAPAQAIAIGDGKILAVGSDAEIAPWIGEQTKQIGLGGKVVLPGLADGHLHLFGLGSRGARIDLVGTKSIAEIKDRVARAVREARPGAWIRGRGWDQNDWGTGGRFPSARDLDAVAPATPVVLERIDGHAIWVNSAAMKAAGITAAVRDPPGGKVLRSGGQPSGVFIDNASGLVEAFAPPPAKADLLKAALIAERECLQAGLTEVHEMGVGSAELEVLRQLDAAGDLRLRIHAYLDGSAEDLDGLMGDGPQLPKDGRRLTVRGVKFYLDGALGSRGAALLAPYQDDPKNSGLITMDEALFEARVRSVKERGYQPATHAIGDRANRLALDVYQRVYGKAALAGRPRIEHAQVLALEDLPRFGELGVVASMQPTHGTSDAPWAEARIGPQRAQGAYAWRSLLARGATIAAGSDAPVEQVSPLLGIFAAIFRADPSAFPLEPWRPEERVSPLAAVGMFTRGVAYAGFREDRAGKIEVGFDADLTVLDTDPLHAGATDLLASKVALTVVGGEIAYAAPNADRPPPARTSSTSP
jgi:hypothetical protein